MAEVAREAKSIQSYGYTFCLFSSLLLFLALAQKRHVMALITCIVWDDRFLQLGTITAYRGRANIQL